MATINIPDGLLTGDELRQFQEGIDAAGREKRRTGAMTLARFTDIIKNVCYWIWDKIKGFLTRIWKDLQDFFSQAMAQVYIPPGLLSPSDERALQNAVDQAAREKRRNGWISLSRFKEIIRRACSWIWDIIEGFVSIWYTLS